LLRIGRKMPSRRIEDLHPVVQRKCRDFLAACEKLGLKAIVISTLRTEAEQLALFSQGRKNLKTVNELRHEAGLPPITENENRRRVTKALTSMHMFGVAFDVALIRNGKVMWDTAADVNENGVADYVEIGKIGEALGLEWGGRFTFKDFGHFQYTGGLIREELRAGKRPDPPEADKGMQEGRAICQEEQG
jgi:peptidoglycan L-alanyl-D-glutamate endopeptidase CwlK